MRYLVHFSSGNTTTINSDDFAELKAAMEQRRIHSEARFFQTKDLQLIDVFDKIDFFEPERPTEFAERGVITRPSPQDIKDQAKKEHDKIVADPKAIINRVKRKSENE